MNTMPLEAATRQLIDTNLKNLGWQFTGEGRNVYLEQPKTESERKKLGGKRPDYVLYSKESDKPLIVIEAKKKGERIDTALEQGIFYAKQLEAPLVYATDGVFCKSFHTLGNTTPKLNGEDVDEFIREALALKFLAKWEVNTVSPKVQYDRRELIRIFDEANNMLRGDGLRAGIERFGEFANILFLKLISETEDNKKLAGKCTSFDDMCHWDYIKSLKPNSRIEHINKIVYEKLNALYGTTIFTPLLIKDNDILKSIIDKLDPLTLTDVDSDVKGDAFEYFLKESTSTKNDLGEYFTPRHIVKTMVRLVNPQIGEKIYDPFCGTGGFLIETFRHIERNMVGGNPKLQKILREETVYGNEITNTARITKMNMILAGDGHSNIHMRDSLANPVYLDNITRNDKGEISRDNENNIELSDGNYDGYDVVITNMPYSQKTNYGSLYDIPSTNGDSICVQHCMRAINSLSQNGRMALVVPEGFLFRKDLAKMREYMIERCELQSVISLPQGVFLPYTGVKTNIIYATKVNQKVPSKNKRKDFWYFDVKSDGYTLDNHRRKLETPSDLSKYEEYRKLDADQAKEMMQVGFEAIPLDKVYENSFVLVGSRYRTPKTQDVSYPLINLGDDKYFTILSGGTPSSSNPSYWDGEVNWITLADLPAGNFITKIFSTERTISTEGLNNSSAKLLPINTVVVSSRATIGRVGITKTELATNQGFKNIIINDHSIIMPEYLACILTAKKDEMLHMASGATFKEISKENFMTIQIPLPSLATQKKLVDELNSYQRLIDAARTILENYKPSIRLDPNWNFVNVGELFIVVSDTIDPQTETGIVNYIGLENIMAETGDLIGVTKADIKTIKSTKKVFQRGDILYGKLRPNLNKVWFANIDGICSTDIIVLRPKTAEILAKFYCLLLREDVFNAQVLNGVSGGQLPRVDISYFLSLPIRQVPFDNQQRLLKQIETEQLLVDPSKELIEMFEEKLINRVNEIWGE